MGGCSDLPGTCTANSCRGHEVDIMHFSIGNAIPGRLYGSNLMDNINGTGKDRCAETSIAHIASYFMIQDANANGKDKSDLLSWLQDVQFTIGQVSKVAMAFWYPTNGNPWSKSDHYSASCNWLPLDIPLASSGSVSRASSGSWDAATAFAMLLSVVSLCVAVFIGYRVSSTREVPFTPIDRL
ncbi:hypothetical protein B296_00003203 [Ensete ventricosum]|uniref:Uncharacterized protein n=1 Tax=Ensete ventricosum TaxID=4639 RepID=A0A427B8L0_ENSVE|nr:hypothetical protein B296_00003203 [Ensete ventricosum]